MGLRTGPAPGGRGRALPARRRRGPAGLRGVGGGCSVPLAFALGGGTPELVRRAAVARRAPCPRHARLPREPRGPADGDRLVPFRQAGRGDLPRRAGGGAGRRPDHGTLGAPRAPYHRAHLGARAAGLGRRALDPLLGLQLLPDLRRGEGPGVGLHVGPARGDARTGVTLRLRGRGEGRARLPAQDQRPGTGFVG